MSLRSVKMTERSEPQSEDDEQLLDDEQSDDEDEDYAGSEEDEQDIADEDPGEHLHEEDDKQGASGSLEGWSVLEVSRFKKLQDEAASYIQSVLGVPSKSQAMALLIAYRWDKERVMSAVADRGPEHVYRMAGIVDPSAETPITEAASTSGFVSCQVCCSEADPGSWSAMDCGHAFCNECWRQHFKTQIAEGQARSLRCMAYKCGIACDADKVVELLRPMPQLLDKYEQARIMSFVEDNANVTFCPSVPWCGRAIQADEPFCEPECSCGTVFCFKCGKGPHSPCTCEMWSKWDEKITGDSETKNWITANTKPCPKCQKLVEKNGGCNHVTCKCGQSFCWLCGASTGVAHTWQSIEGHQCGRFKDIVDKRVNEAQRSHKRYMFYFERWKQHNDSHSKEKNKRMDLMLRIDSKMTDGVEARDYSWLVKALDQLKAARGVLATSYVFAYFFFGNELYHEDFTAEENLRNQNLFEDQQQTLELEVERLSGMVEKCTETLTMDQQERVKVINSSVNIQERILRLYDLIETDLYGKLQRYSAQISMYRPKRNCGF